MDEVHTHVDNDTVEDHDARANSKTDGYHVIPTTALVEVFGQRPGSRVGVV